MNTTCPTNAARDATERTERSLKVLIRQKAQQQQTKNQQHMQSGLH